MRILGFRVVVDDSIPKDEIRLVGQVRAADGSLRSQVQILKMSDDERAKSADRELIDRVLPWDGLFSGVSDEEFQKRSEAILVAILKRQGEL